MSSIEPVRISKLMSERGLCSRREADRYIAAGQVLVDGVVISELGTRAHPDAVIELKKKAQRQQDMKVTIILNKPLGYVSTQPEDGYRAAIELITPENQIKTPDSPKYDPSHKIKLGVTGRIDIDSKGLLIFTQDGALAKKIIGEGTTVEKEYIVRVDGDVTDDIVKRLRHGLSLDGVVLKRAQVEVLEPQLLRFILTEGKKRQIRRMCELVGLKVEKLKRVRIGNIRLGDLPEGCWQYLMVS